jgi:hypothetical protein
MEEQTAQMESTVDCEDALLLELVLESSLEVSAKGVITKEYEGQLAQLANLRFLQARVDISAEALNNNIQS